MLKKFLLLAAAAVCSLSSFAASSFGDLDSTAGTCTLLKVDGDATLETIVVPDYGPDNLKVTKIAAHAIENMPNVTSITIGQYVQAIGNLEIVKGSTGHQAIVGDTYNFSGCPKLKTFTVTAGSEYFSATGAGILMIKGMGAIVRVPQAIEVTDNTLKLSSSASNAVPGAFAENTTIKKLILPTGYSISGEDNSFNDMVNLQEFAVNGSSTPLYYSIIGGVLLNDTQTKIISFPPAKQTMSYSCPLSVTEIGYKAFANTKLYQVDMPYVAKIGTLAFFKSGITQATLFTTKYESVGRYAFCEAPRLSKITINRAIEIPDYFATDCPQLTEVIMPQKAVSVGRGAFRGCAKLKSFPFDASTDFSCDSIFEGCGFDQVVFTGTFTPPSATSLGYRMGKGMFANNTNLTFINMQGIIPSGSQGMLSLNQRFATGCPNLTKIWFPQATYFNEAHLNQGIFGENPPIDEMVLGGFDFKNRLSVFQYTSGAYYPTIYALTTDVPMQKWDYEALFQTQSPATCIPTIYCEAYSMLSSDMGKGSYIYPGALYYIPGGTQMYEGAKGKASAVVPMFDFEALDRDGYYELSVANALDGLTFNDVMINGKSQGTFGEDGKLVTEVSTADVRSVDLYYTINGIKMHTIYPRAAAGIGAVASDAAGGMQLNVTADGITFGTEADYVIYDLTGRIADSGRGTRADTATLPAGIFLVRATASGTTLSTKIIR